MRPPMIAVAFCVFAAISVHASGRVALLGLDLYRPAPHDNPQTPPKIALGRRLFHDRALSRDGSLSCAACHDPARAFTNGRPAARGVNGTSGRRNVPTLVNRAWGASYFWDGRAATLEQQALGPMLNPGELGATPDHVVALARSRDYVSEFSAIFGHDPTLSDVAAALASYVRTIVSGDAPFDRFVSGNFRALSDRAKRGSVLFRTKARCNTCHAGPLLSDEQFHNTGVAWRTGMLADEGRFRVTRSPADRGAFKTPTLREIRRTAPYMHDGSFQTLAAVIEFYDNGGISNPALDREIRPLHLSRTEKKDLLAFLLALTGRIQDGL
jgi:cytochrome c peroxidase